LIRRQPFLARIRWHGFCCMLGANHKEREFPMLYYAIVFLVIAIIAAVLGFGGIAGAASGIAQILFFVFLVLFVLSLIFGRRGGV
jgi:uncharacterized membrane protein YtjA (UPF0391 family)